MSTEKIVVPGFGIGSSYGTPSTVALAQTSTVTLTGTVLPAGQYYAAGLVSGASFNLISTTNGVTGTYVILTAAPGPIPFYDGSSGVLINTTTSLSIVFIGV